MATAGYQSLIDQFGLPCIAPAAPVEVRPVTRITQGPDHFHVPPHVAPAANAAPIEQLLFAIRYEGLDLAVIDALAAGGFISDADVAAAFAQQPNSLFGRRLGYAWELVTERPLTGLPEIAIAYAPLYDPEIYYTGENLYRNSKWRLEFNGLGMPGYCPTVRRTAALHGLLGRDLFAEVDAFAEEAREAGMLDRILNWAYLAETQSSYDIEREQPPADKAEAFMHALRQAHEARDLDEAYLTELQNLIVTNPMSREAGFRNSQNWLARGGQGALAVRYVPPAPDDLYVTMGEFLLAANVRQPQLPLLQAALNSFGFVYLHPFMDGNGRISRFLFHHALCRAGKLSNGLILPTSAAMKHEELGYLAALETFSRPVRALWNVRWISGSDYELTPRCRPAVYRYWDATAQCEFGARMAAMAVDVHLIKERDFLASFDRAFKRLDDALDMPSTLLHRLIVMCQENAGVMSKNRRKQYQDRLPAPYFDTIEREVRDAFGLAEPTQASEKSESSAAPRPREG